MGIHWGTHLEYVGKCYVLYKPLVLNCKSTHDVMKFEVYMTTCNARHSQ